jgi:hypothetical protein
MNMTGHDYFLRYTKLRPSKSDTYCLSSIMHDITDDALQQVTNIIFEARDEFGQHSPAAKLLIIAIEAGAFPGAAEIFAKQSDVAVSFIRHFNLYENRNMDTHLFLSCLKNLVPNIIKDIKEIFYK